MAGFGASKAAERPAGIPCRSQSDFAQAFDPSIRAASLVGPKTGSPRACSSSTSPSTSGASGPTTVRSIDSRSATSTSAGTSVADASTEVAI